ncbi:MAG: PAS domain S-box protein [Halobacteriaceae archaeon]
MSTPNNDESMTFDRMSFPTEESGERELLQYKQMVNTMMESAAVYSQDYRFEVVNDYLAEWYGSSREDLIGTRSMLLPLIENSSEEAPIEELLRGEREYVEGEIEGRFPGHGYAILDYRLTALRTGDAPDKLVAVTREITDRVRRERNLRKSRESYRDLFHGINDAVFVHEPDGNFKAVNETACERLGYSESELEHLSPADIDAPDHAEYAAERIATIEENGSHSFESVHVTKSGERIPVDVSSTAIEYFGEDAILSVARDISTRKANEDDLRKMRRAVEEAGLAIFITDTDGRIEYVNPAFELITGYSRDEALGRNPRILQSGELDRNYYERMWESILQGEVWQEEIPNRRKSGELYFANQTIAPITTNGAVRKFVAIQQDISERKEREQHLQVFNRMLRHNHRNLLNLIVGAADSLDTPPTSQEAPLTRILRDASQELHELSEKAFTITQLLMDEKCRVPITDFDAEVQTLLSEFEDRYPNANISHTLEGVLDFRANPHFPRVIRELVENALEHSGRRDVCVEVHIEQTATHLDVSVEDNGSGIPEHEYGVVTGERELTQITHGSGLGLWLSYWIVRRSGGDLNFHVSDEGTSVCVELPLAQENDDDLRGPDQ